MYIQPQRIRVHGDENAPPPPLPGKTNHQRNKSTPALSSAIGAATKRAAFGDVSNKANLLRNNNEGKKPSSSMVTKPGILSQPAQRHASVSGLRDVLNNVTNSFSVSGEVAAKPPAVVGVRRVLGKKATSVFKDLAPPPPPSQVESKPVAPTEEEEKQQQQLLLLQGREMLNTHNDDSGEMYMTAPEAPEHHRELPRNGRALLSEPEEYSDEEEDENEEDDGYTTARSGRSRGGDNTTGGATTVLFPQYSQQVRRELALAKHIVESTRSAEEIEDEYLDTSMVAEYNDDIFTYMKEQEVSRYQK